MKKRYRTPGVYVEEISMFPKSIAQVETAIPAFIGYSEIALRDSTSLLNIPIRISSMIEFEEYFGSAFPSRFELSSAVPSDPVPVKIEGQMKSLLFLPDQQGFLILQCSGFFFKRRQFLLHRIGWKLWGAG